MLKPMFHDCGQEFYVREGTDEGGKHIKYLETPYGTPYQRLLFTQSCPTCLRAIKAVMAPNLYHQERAAGRAGPKARSAPTLF